MARRSRPLSDRIGIGSQIYADDVGVRASCARWVNSLPSDFPPDEMDESVLNVPEQVRRPNPCSPLMCKSIMAAQRQSSDYSRCPAGKRVHFDPRLSQTISPPSLREDRESFAEKRSQLKRSLPNLKPMSNDWNSPDNIFLEAEEPSSAKRQEVTPGCPPSGTIANVPVYTNQATSPINVPPSSSSSSSRRQRRRSPSPTFRTKPHQQSEELVAIRNPKINGHTINVVLNF